jgi:hypothetical protein
VTSEFAPTIARGILLAVALVSMGCGDDGGALDAGSGPIDARVIRDASRDAGPDAGAATLDASLDTGPPPGDAWIDVGTDAPMSRPDSGPPVPLPPCVSSRTLLEGGLAGFVIEDGTSTDAIDRYFCSGAGPHYTGREQIFDLVTVAVDARYTITFRWDDREARPSFFLFRETAPGTCDLAGTCEPPFTVGMLDARLVFDTVANERVFIVVETDPSGALPFAASATIGHRED